MGGGMEEAEKREREREREREKNARKKIIREERGRWSEEGNENKMKKNEI